MFLSFKMPHRNSYYKSKRVYRRRGRIHSLVSSGVGKGYKTASGFIHKSNKSLNARQGARRPLVPSKIPLLSRRDIPLNKIKIEKVVALNPQSKKRKADENPNHNKKRTRLNNHKRSREDRRVKNEARTRTWREYFKRQRRYDGELVGSIYPSSPSLRQRQY